MHAISDRVILIAILAVLVMANAPGAESSLLFAEQIYQTVDTDNQLPLEERTAVDVKTEDLEAQSKTLTMGLVQMALEGTLSENRDKIAKFIQDARYRGCRLVVFPEGALFPPPDAKKADIDSAVAVIQEAAKENRIYVILNMMYRQADEERLLYSLLVLDPEGKVIQRYHKNPSKASPGIFYVDDIPCSAMICSDRWSREIEELPAMKGSKILFECSNNYEIEWVPELEWFWYVPRALRNGVYTVFVNTATNPDFGKFQHLNSGHGHTAVIAPDGSIEASLGEEPDQLLVTNVDISRASSDEAMRRREHPVFRPFWEVGLKILDGNPVDVPPVEIHDSSELSVRMAVAQMACSRNIADNPGRMKRMIQDAKSNEAHVIVFPELAVTGTGKEDIERADEATLNSALAKLQETAKEEGIYVVFGMPYQKAGKRQNCAFVLSPYGKLLTRHAQIVVDDTELFEPGSSTHSMWFRLNGVPSVVTVGRREALWNEIAELAAVRGAQMHFHLSYDLDTTPTGALIRKQIWVNLASFHTFTATVNAASPDGIADPSSSANGGSIIWEDFRHHRGSGPYPYSAAVLVEAGVNEQIIYAEQTVKAKNPQSRKVASNRRGMKDWYEMGARVVSTDEQEPKPPESFGVRADRTNVKFGGLEMKIERWDTCEISFTASNKYENPFQDVELTGTFTHHQSGETITVYGFYDGGSTWRIRFMPTELGLWEYVTKSTDAGLGGKMGEITCKKPTQHYLHGPLRAKGHHFIHDDGTPRFLISTRMSCPYASPEVWKRMTDFLNAHNINRVLFIMGGISGTVKELYGEGLDFWQYNLEKFQAIDAFIDAMRRADILASPYFYYFNDREQRKMTPEQDKAYIRYGMSRFGAYTNVMPVLSNEVDQKFTDRKAQYDLASHDWGNEMGEYLSELAVFGVPVAVHNPMETDNAINPGFYTLLMDWPFPWTDFMLRQAQLAALSTAPELRDDIPEQKAPIYNVRGYSRHNQLLIDLRRFGIPVINEEPGYEMYGHSATPKNDKINLRPWNSQTPDTLVPTFWSAVAAGGYVMWGHYDTYEMDDPLPGMKRSPTPEYLKILHDFVTDLPYWEMEPANDLVSANEEKVEGKPYRMNFCLAKKGEIYLIFSLNGGQLTADLASGINYKAVQMDPRTGKKADLGQVEGGEQKFSLDGKEQVLLLKAESI